MAQFFLTLTHSTLTLPAFEVALLLIILALCLVFRYSGMGLMISYVFAYRWGWSFFAGQSQDILVSYLIFGCLVGVLSTVGLLSGSRPH